jgi:hypothetical protein
MTLPAPSSAGFTLLDACGALGCSVRCPQRTAPDALGRAHAAIAKQAHHRFPRSLVPKLQLWNALVFEALLRERATRPVQPPPGSWSFQDKCAPKLELGSEGSFSPVLLDSAKRLRVRLQKRLPPFSSVVLYWRTAAGSAMELRNEEKTVSFGTRVKSGGWAGRFFSHGQAGFPSGQIPQFRGIADDRAGVGMRLGPRLQLLTKPIHVVTSVGRQLVLDAPDFFEDRIGLH